MAPVVEPCHRRNRDLRSASSYFRLNASSYITWAQATDQDGGTLHWTPLRDNNVDWAEIGRTTKWPNRLVTVNVPAKDFTVRDELYQIGQFAKYLGPEHTRVESSGPSNGVNNVVFKDKSNRYVAVVSNDNATSPHTSGMAGGTS